MILLLATALAAPPTDWTVRIDVSNMTGPADLTIRAMTRWGSADLAVALLDDGSGPGDMPLDGIWTGTLLGPPTDALDLVLILERTAMPPIEIAREQVAISDGERIAFQLDLDPVRARRAAAPLLTRRLPATDARSRAASIGWVAFLLAVGAWWLGR